MSKYSAGSHVYHGDIVGGVWTNDLAFPHWQVGALYVGSGGDVYVCVYLDDARVPRNVGMVTVGSNPFFKHVITRGPDWWYRRVTKIARPETV